MASRTNLLSLLVLAAISTKAHAAHATDSEGAYPRAGTFSPLDPFHAGFGIGSGVGWVTDQSAQTNLTGSTGATLHLDVAADVFDLFSIGASMGTIFLRDDGKFKQWVIDSQGTVSNAESSMTLTIVAPWFGVRTPDFCLGANQERKAGYTATYGYVHFGYAHIGGSRYIGNCVDCRAPALVTPSGTFIEMGASIGLKANDSWGLSLFTGVRHYFSPAAAAGEWQIGYLISYW